MAGNVEKVANAGPAEDAAYDQRPTETRNNTRRSSECDGSHVTGVAND